MTDKNIIDEVNVSRCKYFNNGWCLLSESCDVIKYKSCGDMTLADCYYRNWQRKEQEVQQAMDNYVQLDLQRVKEYNELVDLYKAKEQECEELKKELMKKDEVNTFFNTPIEGWSNDPCGICKQNSKEMEIAYKSNLKLCKYQEQQINKLATCIEDIKDIAEGMHDLWINKTPYTDMDNLVKHLLECELNRIRYKLDEISECEIENDN